MPAPTNTTSATAVDITSLPYSVTQNVHDAGTTYSVWYKHTATVDATLGLWGFGDVATYRPTTFIYITNPAGAAFLQYQNRPIQFPVTAGLTYYFRFVTNGGNPSPASLAVSLLQHPEQTAPVGSIAVPDTAAPFPLSINSATADYTVLRFVLGFEDSEYGADILPNGIVAIGQGPDVILYDSNYTQIAFTTHTLGENLANICTNRLDTFYISSGNPYNISPAEVTTVSNTGVQGATTWTLDATEVVGIGVSPDESILYYVTNVADDPVRRWDLVNDVALSDLAAGVDADTICIRNVLVLADGTLLVGYRNDTALTEFVRHYSAAGAVLDTYSLNYATSDVADFLFTGLDDTSFWIWQHDGLTIGSNMQFVNVRISDGTVLATRLGASYDGGKYMYLETATPLARFGFSKSCPAWITRTGSAPVPDSELNGPAGLATLRAQGRLADRVIRRLRRSPILFNENKRIGLNRFELFCTTGEATVTGQGSDPTIIFELSRDSGRTWPLSKQLQTGTLGEYLFRCYTHQLGQGRQIVIQCSQTDPVPTVWTGASIEPEEGIS